MHASAAAKQQRRDIGDGGGHDGDKRDTKVQPEPAWKTQKRNNDADEWCIPKGKYFKDYFGDDGHGNENQEKFDGILVKHHTKTNLGRGKMRRKPQMV